MQKLYKQQFEYKLLRMRAYKYENNNDSWKWMSLQSTLFWQWFSGIMLSLSFLLSHLLKYDWNFMLNLWSN
jgi:hypothetical protein